MIVKWIFSPTTGFVRLKRCCVCLQALAPTLRASQGAAVKLSAIRKVSTRNKLLGRHGLLGAKSSIFIGFSIINHPFLGYPHGYGHHDGLARMPLHCSISCGDFRSTASGPSSLMIVGAHITQHIGARIIKCESIVEKPATLWDFVSRFPLLP